MKMNVITKPLAMLLIWVSITLPATAQSMANPGSQAGSVLVTPLYAQEALAGELVGTQRSHYFLKKNKRSEIIEASVLGPSMIAPMTTRRRKDAGNSKKNLGPVAEVRNGQTVSPLLVTKAQNSDLFAEIGSWAKRWDHIVKKVTSMAGAITDPRTMMGSFRTTDPKDIVRKIVAYQARLSRLDTAEEVESAYRALIKENSSPFHGEQGTVVSLHQWLREEYSMTHTLNVLVTAVQHDRVFLYEESLGTEQKRRFKENLELSLRGVAFCSFLFDLWEARDAYVFPQQAAAVAAVPAKRLSQHMNIDQLFTEGHTIYRFDDGTEFLFRIEFGTTKVPPKLLPNGDHYVNGHKTGAWSAVTVDVFDLTRKGDQFIGTIDRVIGIGPPRYATEPRNGRVLIQDNGLPSNDDVLLRLYPKINPQSLTAARQEHEKANTDGPLAMMWVDAEYRNHSLESGAGTLGYTHLGRMLVAIADRACRRYFNAVFMVAESNNIPFNVGLGGKKMAHQPFNIFKRPLFDYKSFKNLTIRKDRIADSEAVVPITTSPAEDVFDRIAEALENVGRETARIQELFDSYLEAQRQRIPEEFKSALDLLGRNLEALITLGGAEPFFRGTLRLVRDEFATLFQRVADWKPPLASSPTFPPRAA